MSARRGPEHTCTVCGASYYRPPSAIKPGRGYCSRPCYTVACKQRGGLQGRHGRQRWHWEPWQLRLLEKRYDSRPQTITWLVEQLHMPRHRVHYKARTLGLTRQKEAAWRDEDLEYLHAHLATQSYQALARHLGRTAVSVQLKVKRLGLTKRGAGGYTGQELARLLGCDAHKVTQWIARGWLVGGRRHTTKVHDEYYLSEADVKTFLVTWRGEIDLRRVDRDWFIDLLADPSVRVRSRG